MGKKNRNKRNRLEKLKINDSNPGSRWSVAILDARKESELDLEGNEDIISSMPGDILSHVISFLPFESAVQTGWKDAWKRNFSEQKGSIDDAFAAISSFLPACFDVSSERKPTSNRGFIFNLGKRSFISVAADPGKALQLDFSNVKNGFPCRFDWSLDIHGFPFSYRVYIQSLVPKPSSFSFQIKTLHLKSVSHIFSGAISSLMINFKFLESLIIEKCHGLRCFKLEAEVDSRLKKLTILDCQELESLHLNYYSLKSLRIRGKLSSFQVAVYGSSILYWQPWSNDIELDDAMLDFRQGPHNSNIETDVLQSFFRGITNYVKSLTISGWIFEPVIYPMQQLYPFPFCFKFNRLTELWWIDYSKERFNSNALIAFLNLCPRLTRLYVTIDPKSYRRTSTMSNYSVDAPSVPILEDLKVVKLEGFRNEKEEIILAKRLKKEFHVEPLIIAKSTYLNCVRLMVKEDEVYDQLKIREDSYKFIETRVEHFCMIYALNIFTCASDFNYL